MKCEFCNRTLRQGDMIHGIKYGSLASSGFVPAKDSAVTVLCGDCGNRIYRLVYASLYEGRIAYPVILSMYNELTSLMKNGYKLIQAIAKLPATEQRAIQRMIETCKSAR